MNYATTIGLVAMNNIDSEIWFKFPQEVSKWENMNNKELIAQLNRLKAKAGHKLMIILHLIFYHFIFFIFGITFCAYIVILSWLPVTKVVEWLKNSPYIAAIISGAIFLPTMMLLTWAFLAEDQKLFKRITKPLDIWDKYIRERQIAMKKVEALQILLQNRLSG